MSHSFFLILYGGKSLILIIAPPPPTPNKVLSELNLTPAEEENAKKNMD
jgi:hypothetical protein